MFELFVQVVLIVFFIVLFVMLMVTGWIMYVFAAFMVFLVLAFFAEIINNSRLYKSRREKEFDK